MVLTFVLSIIWNVEVGIAVTMVLSLLLVVNRSSKTRMVILVSPSSAQLSQMFMQLQGRLPGTDRWKPVDENPDAEEDVTGVLIVRIRDNLDFANTAQLKGA